MAKIKDNSIIVSFERALSENNYTVCDGILDSLSDEEGSGLLFALADRVGMLIVVYLIHRGIVLKKPFHIVDAAVMLQMVFGYFEGADVTEFYLMKLASEQDEKSIPLKENVLQYMVNLKDQWTQNMMVNVANDIIKLDPENIKAKQAINHFRKI